MPCPPGIILSSNPTVDLSTKPLVVSLTKSLKALPAPLAPSFIKGLLTAFMPPSIASVTLLKTLPTPFLTAPAALLISTAMLPIKPVTPPVPAMPVRKLPIPGSMKDKAILPKGPNFPKAPAILPKPFLSFFPTDFIPLPIFLPNFLNFPIIYP